MKEGNLKQIKLMRKQERREAPPHLYIKIWKLEASSQFPEPANIVQEHKIIKFHESKTEETLKETY